MVAVARAPHPNAPGDPLDGINEEAQAVSRTMTPADRALIESAAKAAGVSVSAWIVHTAREEARWAIARKIAGEIAAEFGVTDADREWAASVLGLDADDWKYSKMPG
jgi:hypothetical protein